MLDAFKLCLAGLLCLPAVALVASRGKKARVLPSALLTMFLLMGAVVGGTGFWHGGRLTLDLPYLAPFSFTLTLDRLSAFFLLLICAVGAPVALFSGSYVERHYQRGRRDWIW